MLSGCPNLSQIGFAIGSVGWKNFARLATSSCDCRRILHADQKEKQNRKEENLFNYFSFIIPMNERKSIDIEQGNYSLSAHDTWRSKFKQKTNSILVAH